MKQKTLKSLLIEINACEPAMEWFENTKLENIEEVVEKCHRGDWLIWLAKKVSIDSKSIYIARQYYIEKCEEILEKSKSINIGEMETGSICRKYIGNEIIRKVNELLNN